VPHRPVLNVIFRGILELDVLIVARLSLLYLIKNWVVGNSFKFDEYNIFWWVIGSTGVSGSTGNYVTKQSPPPPSLVIISNHIRNVFD
jgi:hypothetical protein